MLIDEVDDEILITNEEATLMIDEVVDDDELIYDALLGDYDVNDNEIIDELHYIGDNQAILEVLDEVELDVLDILVDELDEDDENENVLVLAENAYGILEVDDELDFMLAVLDELDDADDDDIEKLI